MPRTASVTRVTKETDIEISLDLDGSGQCSINTGMAFFDHMLNLMGNNALIDLQVKAQGDLEIDCHHTVEDCGLVLGECLQKALGDRKGIKRYGNFTAPMDDALAAVALDLSNRPYVRINLPEGHWPALGFDPSMVGEFFRAFANKGGFNLHVTVPYGDNYHHIVEAVFKAFGRALCEAVTVDPRRQGVPSTKGVL